MVKNMERTMTAEREAHLQIAQRRMLRKMIGAPRKQVEKDSASSVTSSNGGTQIDEDEDADEKEEEGKCDKESWVDWVRRVTHNAEEHLRKAKISDWITEQRRRKWRFAGHTARREDARWTKELLGWRPDGTRFAWRPLTRWTDVLDKFWKSLGKKAGGWLNEAQNRKKWCTLEAEFIKCA